MKWTESFWPAVFLAGFFGVWGLGWGLPSTERTKLFLRPELQNELFYQKVDKARDDYYAQIGINPMAHVGRMAREGKSYHQSDNILSSYSSFLVRTHHGDEQATLVMLSHLNPLKGKWYPYTYAYGGAYLYPLAGYLGALHCVRLIRLVPQASYYYAHPDEIAKVFFAVRGWSVIGWILSIIPLFFIARRVGGPRIAFWASCFYALLPACIGNAKLAKPHIWATAWTLTAIWACLRAKQDTGLKYIALAGISYGLALGTTLSQTACFPFFIWACWTPSLRTTVQRAGVVGTLTVLVFLLTNFYLFAHLQDFRDELFFLQKYSPFGFRLGALWDFAYGSLRPSYGTLPWIMLLLSTGWCLFQKHNPLLRTVAILSLCVFFYMSCQVQSQNGDPVASRLCAALMGLGCLFIAVFIDRLPKGAWIGGAIGVLLIGKAVVYDLHFASDRAPYDNASLAGIWITEHVPAGSLISHSQVIPHVIDFPPLDFERYKIVSFDSPEFKTASLPMYAVIPEWAVGSWRQRLIDQHFTLVKRFAESPLQKLGYDDPFTTANFPLELYKRGA